MEVRAFGDELENLWNKIETVVNDDSVVNTIATVTDWLDTKLDQAEVKAARMAELKKIQVDFEGSPL